MGDFIRNHKAPKYGLKVKLNHVYPENRSQDYTPSFRIIWELFPLILRYIIYYIISKIWGRSIVMDYVQPLRAKRIYGVPIGGIGAGTIGRGFRGEFCRFQLKPGLYEYNTVDANQFIVTIKEEHDETIFHSLLSTFPRKSLSAWESLIEGDKCHYTGLYPRAWTEYDLSEYGIKLTCRQISPVIPHNYTDSSLPCAVFVWHIENVSNSQKTVTIAFMFKNGTGNKKEDKRSICSSKSFSYCNSEGIILNHTINKTPCSYALSIVAKPDVTISKCLYFDPNSDGVKPWIALKNNGHFEDDEGKPCEQIHGEIGVGIASKLIIPAGESKQTVMSLVWDMPTISFPGSIVKHDRFYAANFGKDSTISIVEHVFKSYPQWESAIDAWQNPILQNDELPPWYKGALFNESYFLSDGGTVWLALNATEAAALPGMDIRQKVGRFAYLEGHEYRMYNTYDVHFYASFALWHNFPLLQYALQYDVRDAIFVEIPDKMKMLYDGKLVERKKPNTVPHDIGDPGDRPFTFVNSYPIQDVSNWRDLNTKFVLQVFRDGYSSNVDKCDKIYLEDMYNACYIVMHKSLEFDVDDDGLIENSGYPDQTYDTWVMCGSSAYCGGLWLAALFAMTKIANVLGKYEDETKFNDLLSKGKKAYEEKLWNGQYYNFDTSEKQCRTIMADQLCANWYLTLCGYPYQIYPESHVRSVLRTIYNNNVMGFCDGEMGAVNGFIDGHVDEFALQSLEVWTGVTYALAANMIYGDMVEEGFKTAGGMYKSMNERFGLAFETPEALYAKKHYRALGYMRPLSIWSMQLALNQRIKQKQQ